MNGGEATFNAAGVSANAAGLSAKVGEASAVASSKSIGRLPSIRASRDLNLTAGIRPATLLAARGTRKVFVPVLDAQRYRDTKQPAVGSDRARGRGGRGGHSGRAGGRDRTRGGRGGNKAAQYIQTTGTAFSEGVAASNRPRVSSSFGSAGGGSEPSASSMPVFTGNKIVDKEEEERKRAALLRDDFVDDSGAECDELMAPVCLPLSSTRQPTEKQCKIKVKQEPDVQADEVHVKKEKDDSIPTYIGSTGRSLADLFRNKDEISDRLLFLQLPDALPIMVDNDSSMMAMKGTIGVDRNSRQVKSTTAQPTAPPTDKNTNHGDSTTKVAGGVCLSDVENGKQLGVLQVLRSGTVRLVIGSQTLLLERGTDVKFLQEAVSVSSEDSDKASVCILGQVGDRLVCSPDWQKTLSA